MRKSDFGLKIIGGLELSSGLVVLSDGQNYSLRLINYNEELRCDAVIKIDGQSVGRFRVEAFSSITIKRSTEMDKSFVFKTLSDLDRLKFINKNKKDLLGLVEVQFIPEESHLIHDDLVTLKCEFKFLDGVTDYGTQSGQTFKEVEQIQLDYNNSVIVSAKLVSENTDR